MALWQYSFFVVPKNSFEESESYLDKDGFFDDESCWLVEPVETTFFDSIGNLLPKSKSWSDDIILYGSEESNRFEVIKNDNDHVVSVSFRIDYTSNYEEILRGIVDFAIMKGLYILNEDLERLDSNVITIKSYIDNSTQRDIYEKLSDKEE